MSAPTPASAPGQRLALLYQLSQAFNSTLDLEEVLNRVMDEVIVATHAERGFVMLHDETGQLQVSVARGLEQQNLDLAKVSLSVIQRVAHDGQPVLTSDAQADERFNMRQSVMILGLRSVLCVPLKAKDHLLGVIYVDNRMQAGIFNNDDLDLLNAIAATAAIAIDNARLYRLAVEKGRLERELQMARQVQTRLLPETTPEFPGWEFAACWLPARQVAGDYYDFVALDDQRLGLIIGDVTDKGMHAALFMALSRSTLRASVMHGASPVESITSANQLLCADSQSSMFVTLFYAELSQDNGNRSGASLRYVNAGHNPPLYYHASQDRLERLSRTGMALGVEPQTVYEQRLIQPQHGDFLVLYTDGVTDARSPAGEEFGMPRLEAMIYAHRHEPAELVVAALQAELEEFTGGSIPVDDVTMMFARCVGEADHI